MKEDVDVLILCWEEAELVRDSIYRLKKEGWNIIVVDNGSDERNKAILRAIDGITLVDLPENLGASKGRNEGLKVSTAKYVFLLDGDILYIPETIENLIRLFKLYPDAGCIGVHNTTRWNGTQIRSEADICWLENDPPRMDFPMAWTQYGLFDGQMLRALKFVTTGAFGEPGNGYEDDWLYRDIKNQSKESYYVAKPLYYHEAHGGQRMLTKYGLSNKNKERLQIFMNHWGFDPSNKL